MANSSDSKRKQILTEVLQRLVEDQQFADRFSIAEVQQSVEARPHLVRTVVRELADQDILEPVPDSPKTFRWKTNREQFSPVNWAEARVHGSQISQTPEQERPRERLKRLGASHLKTAELLAILIRNGRVGESALQAGEKIVNRLQHRLETLPDLGHAELRAIAKSVSEPAFCQIMGGIELGRRVAAAADDMRVRRIKIFSPAEAIQYCLHHFSRLAREAKQEEFHIVTLDTKNQPLANHLITIGTLKNSLVHPREVFRPAIRDAANSIFVVHNHPSGDPTPSIQDLEITKRLEEAGDLIGIGILDHIIVAGDTALSIREWRSEHP